MRITKDASNNNFIVIIVFSALKILYRSIDIAQNNNNVCKKTDHSLSATAAQYTNDFATIKFCNMISSLTTVGCMKCCFSVRISSGDITAGTS